MSAQYDLSRCDGCVQFGKCQELFVRLKVLEEELHYAQDTTLTRAFERFRTRLEADGYYYPHSGMSCRMNANPERAEAYCRQAEMLMSELRRLVKI